MNTPCKNKKDNEFLNKVKEGKITKKSIANTIPKNYEGLSSEDLFNIFPEKRRSNYPRAVEILYYWENDFKLDWGEPECFGCKQMTFKPEGAGHIANGGSFEVWKDYLEICHITSVCFGGPDKPWNIIFLCPWCHKAFDEVFSGYPNEYHKQLKWLINRRSNLLNWITEDVKKNEKIRRIFEENKVLEFARLFTRVKKTGNYKRYMWENLVDKWGWTPWREIALRQHYVANRLYKYLKL
ncbi:MAG: HNH endonuclease [Bacteroidales bacterium]|nr:HNH endonuclease [Bacteroidales bacterium]